MARQVTFNIYECGITELVQAADGRYDMVSTPICKVEDGFMTDTAVRNAIRDAGYDLKRGVDVYKKCIGKVRYEFTTEDLKSICLNREVLPLDKD